MDCLLVGLVYFCNLKSFEIKIPAVGVVMYKASCVLKVIGQMNCCDTGLLGWLIGLFRG